jgi:hypothetical protein
MTDDRPIRFAGFRRLVGAELPAGRKTARDKPNIRENLKWE